MDGHTPVLAFEEARLAIEPGGGLTVPVTLAVPQGALVTADLRGPRRRLAFAQAASGLNRPAGGTVLFQGRDWQEVPPEHAAAMRGRIGRHFARGAWLPELSIEENILLAPLYHTSRARDALREDAARLAASFGLPGLPTGAADQVPQADLHRAGLVRAFLNAPALVVLEEPTAVDGPDLFPALMEAIRAVRDRGGAVLWLTENIAVALDRTMPAAARWRLVHGAMLPLGRIAA